MNAHQTAIGTKQSASNDTGLADVDPLEGHLQGFWVGGDFERCRSIDQSIVDQLLETHGEVLHPFGRTDSDGVGKLLIFLFEEKFADHRSEGHDLAGRHAGDSLLNRTQQFLRDDAFHVERDGVSNCFVKLFGEEVQDTADGRRSARCVDGSENQVPGFGGVDRRHERLLVPHLTDQDDVRIFPDRMLHEIGRAHV